MALFMSLGCVHGRFEPGPGRVSVPCGDVERLLGSEVVEACPPGHECVFSPANGLFLFHEPEGPCWVALDTSRLYLPPGEQHWDVQPAAGESLTTAPFRLGTGPPPPLRRYAEVAAGVGRERLLVRFGPTEASAPSVVTAPDGGLRVVAFQGWPPFDRTNLSPDDEVLAVGDVVVQTAEELQAAFDSLSGAALLRIRRSGEERVVGVPVVHGSLRCWKHTSPEGRDEVLAEDASPPGDAVPVGCPIHAVGLLLAAGVLQVAP